MASSALKFGGALREIRVHLCQKGEGSKGVRDFLSKDYVGIKKANPQLPFLVRECSGVQAKLWARYDYGKEKMVLVDRMSREQVQSALASLAKP